MSRMQDEINRCTVTAYAGIDVSKRILDVHIYPANTRYKVNNDDLGIRKIAKHCQRSNVQLIALEATGRYHRRAHQILHEAGLPVAVINPFRSRKFAGALGQVAKTDRIDAEILAQFAALLRPKPSLPPSEIRKTLRDLNVARRQVLAESGTLKRQLSETDNPLVARQIRARIKMCQRHQAVLEKDIRELILSQKDLKHRFDILTSIPGLGPLTATTLIIDLEELGQVNCREITALAGLAPMNRDSGIHRGPRIIRGGRMYVRNMLYMCAVGLSRRGGALGEFYRHLIRQGKNPKVALTAVMRKLVILANTLVAQDRHWQPASP